MADFYCRKCGVPLTRDDHFSGSCPVCDEPNGATVRQIGIARTDRPRPRYRDVADYARIGAHWNTVRRGLTLLSICLPILLLCGIFLTCLLLGSSKEESGALTPPAKNVRILSPFMALGIAGTVSLVGSILCIGAIPKLAVRGPAAMATGFFSLATAGGVSGAVIVAGFERDSEPGQLTLTIVFVVFLVGHFLFLLYLRGLAKAIEEMALAKNCTNCLWFYFFWFVLCVLLVVLAITSGRDGTQRPTVISVAMFTIGFGLVPGWFALAVWYLTIVKQARDVIAAGLIRATLPDYRKGIPRV
jgi:hypothetical protein